MINIFVGNLDLNATEEQLQSLFATYGVVETVTIVRDRDTGHARGFAFVEMTQAADAKTAISALNGTLLNNSALRINEARPKLVPNQEKSDGARNHRHHSI